MVGMTRKHGFPSSFLVSALRAISLAILDGQGGLRDRGQSNVFNSGGRGNLSGAERYIARSR